LILSIFLIKKIALFEKTCKFYLFKTILTPEWQETIERYDPVQVPKTSKASPTPRKRVPRPDLAGTRSGKFTTEADLPKPPRKKPFKVGDRARPGAT
jgi:hypothetical protein